MSKGPWWQAGHGRAALATLTIFGIAEALRIARDFLLPVVVALLLAVALAPLVRVLRRLGIPYPPAAAVVVGSLTVVLVVGVWALADPAAGWIDRAPETLRVVERKIRRLKSSVVEAREAAEKVEQITRVDGGEPAPAQVTVKEPSLAARLLDTTQATLLIGAEVLVLLTFLLAFGDRLWRRILALSEPLRSKIDLAGMSAEIEREISAYLFTVTCINAGLGAATAAAMGLLGMPNPVLWGVMAFVFNYVPYLGSGCTTVVLALVALLTFDTLGRALLAPAVFLALATLEGQVVTPLIVGRRMSLSPPLIVIALMAGAWIWGIVGMLIAVPGLALLKIACANTKGLERVADLVGND